jgi:hypothetical protein
MHFANNAFALFALNITEQTDDPIRFESAQNIPVEVTIISVIASVAILQTFRRVAQKKTLQGKI